MASTFLLIHLIAFFIQHDFNGLDQQVVNIKKRNVSSIACLIQVLAKETHLKPASVVDSLPVVIPHEIAVVPGMKVLPSGEMAP